MVCQTISQALERDLASIWHPFNQRDNDSPITLYTKAEGPYLFTQDGTGYLDAISSWWINLHGHNHPKIREAIRAQ